MDSFPTNLRFYDSIVGSQTLLSIDIQGTVVTVEYVITSNPTIMPETKVRTFDRSLITEEQQRTLESWISTLQQHPNRTYYYNTSLIQQELDQWERTMEQSHCTDRLVSMKEEGEQFVLTYRTTYLTFPESDSIRTITIERWMLREDQCAKLRQWMKEQT